MNKLARLLILFTVIFVIPSCTNMSHKDDKHELLRAKSSQEGSSKKVIFIVADSIMYQAIDQGIKQKSLPTFQYMINNGQYYKDIVSSFPTMSVTIDSSILTGTYPDKHHVPGLIWYSSEERRLINYGTGPMETLKQGINPVLSDEFINLNAKHLNPRISTIYEDLARLGLKSGSVNGLIYRGKTDHVLTFPPLLHMPTSLPKHIKVKGPDLLFFGAFTNPLHGKKNLPAGLTQKMGFNNEYAIETVKHLVMNSQLPDFLYVYLPDLDLRLHRKGPSDLKGATSLDGQLRSLLMSFGSMEEAIKKAIIIIIGDSGMSSIVPARQHPVIELPALLKNFNVLQPGATVSSDTEIILAVNETMAYVYNLKSKSKLKNLVEILRTEARMDLIAWEENGWIHVRRAGIVGEFSFKANGNVTDSYKQSWTFVGNEQILDLKRDEKNRLRYGEYPDAMRRLSAAFHSHNGDFIIVTAKPGYELAGHSYTNTSGRRRTWFIPSD
ncbi:alkaline phosphatase family protein [Cohnella sp.]|uniref:alkaline phosphatase family protein n=1 Tax=Cohnella sp. TaxID=1883426 RepID=UPI0035677636